MADKLSPEQRAEFQGAFDVFKDENGILITAICFIYDNITRNTSLQGIFLLKYKKTEYKKTARY